MAAFLAIFAEHPALLPLVVWPLVTAGANLAQTAIRARWPRLAALLAASGLDLVAASRALAKAPPEPPACKACSETKRSHKGAK